MYLTPDDIQAMNRVLAERHRFDPELTQRCAPLLDQGYYHAAVQQAFTILEVRLRERTGAAAIGQSAGDILKVGLANARSPLAMRLGLDPTETAALRDLLSGFYRFFRNPAAHTLLEYEAGEAQAILAMINLLLRLLDRETVPEPKTRYELFFRAVAADLPRHLPPSLRHVMIGPTTEEKSFKVSFPNELPYYFELYFRRSALEMAYHLVGSQEENQRALVYLRSQTAVVQDCFGGQIVAESAKTGARFGHYLKPKPELTPEAGLEVAPLFARLIACIYPHALAAVAVAAGTLDSAEPEISPEGDATVTEGESAAGETPAKKRRRRRGKRGGVGESSAQ